MSIDTKGTGDDDLEFDFDLEDDEDHVDVPKKRTRRRVQVNLLDEKTGLPLSPSEIRRAKRYLSYLTSIKCLILQQCPELWSLDSAFCNCLRQYPQSCNRYSVYPVFSYFPIRVLILLRTEKTCS